MSDGLTKRGADMLRGEPAIVTLHDSTGAQIGEPQVFKLGLPPWPRRALNWILRRPTQYENREPIEWDWSKGDIPAGVTVAKIRITTPYWVQEYDATGPAPVTEKPQYRSSNSETMLTGGRKHSLL